jgi:hypothetical protein
MPTIDELFTPHTAKSAGFPKHAKGDIAYLTNGFRDNGVVGFVKPMPGDRIYRFLGIVLSSFCEATVQIPPFIARGNGGSGLIVLEPRTAMTADQLGFIAAHINTDLRWRFNWYRQATVDRIRRLAIPDPHSSAMRFSVKQFLPVLASHAAPSSARRVTMKPFRLDSLFSLASGDYHNASELPKGNTPLISCGDGKNGITAFVSVPEEKTYSHKLTISFNGMNTLSTKFHPYRFAAKDDVAVCTPRRPLRASTLFFVQIMMNNERWRYSHYRKCFMEKLSRQSVNLPADRSEVDEDAAGALVNSTSYWPYLKKRYEVTN